MNPATGNIASIRALGIGQKIFCYRGYCIKRTPKKYIVSDMLCQQPSVHGDLSKCLAYLIRNGAVQ